MVNVGKYTIHGSYEKGMPLKVTFGASFFVAGNVCPLKHGILDLFAKNEKKKHQ